jgi:hypothetical protein
VTITTTNKVARAVFSANPTATTINRGAGVEIELDAGGAVAAVSFDTHGGAVRLTNMLPRDYNVTLSDADRAALLTTRF